MKRELSVHAKGLIKEYRDAIKAEQGIGVLVSFDSISRIEAAARRSKAESDLEEYIKYLETPA